jgi:aspartate/methionine/tyrosine aminotransferase
VNSRIVSIPPSLIRSINARKRPGDIDLGLGEPTLSPPLDAFVAAVDWTRAHGSPYSPNAGFAELREAIAAYLAEDRWAQGAAGSDQVCVTVGSEEAIYLAIKALVDPRRDEVLIIEPCYLAYPKLCILEDVSYRMVQLNPVDGFRPSATRVLEAIEPATRLILLNSPSNPTGRVWPLEELQALAAGLAERAGSEVYILADEVYRELYYQPTRPPSAATFHPRTLVAGSLSKSNALTGLRLGWLAGPREVIATATTVHQLVNTAASTFAQRVAVELLRDPIQLAAHRPWYAGARERLLAIARGLGLDLLPPEGAFYGFIRLPEEFRGDSVGVAERILEDTRVVTVPGRAFGDSGEGWLRVSWVAPPDALEEGLIRIAGWLGTRGPGG